MGMPGSSLVCAGRDYNPTPNNRLDQSDEIEGCTGFWYAGLGTQNGMGCIRGPTHYSMAAQARSRHTGGVNACFADGHVQLVRDSISSGPGRCCSQRTMSRSPIMTTERLNSCKSPVQSAGSGRL
jgi:prepilin-type processing-associated H-X9-DG protein